jgi:hypothetical protein
VAAGSEHPGFMPGGSQIPQPRFASAGRETYNGKINLKKSGFFLYIRLI